VIEWIPRHFIVGSISASHASGPKRAGPRTGTDGRGPVTYEGSGPHFPTWAGSARRGSAGSFSRRETRAMFARHGTGHSIAWRGGCVANRGKSEWSGELVELLSISAGPRGAELARRCVGGVASAVTTSTNEAKRKGCAVSRRVGLLGLLLLSQVAAAEGIRPSVVLAPMDVDPSDALQRVERSLKDIFFDVLRSKADVTLAGRIETEIAVKSLRRNDFRESDEALKRLADRTSTLYAVYVAVTMDVAKDEKEGKRPVEELGLNARVIRSDGVQVAAKTVRLPLRKDPIVPIFKVLANRLIETLALKDLPAAIEAPPPPVAAAPAPEVPRVELIAPPPPPPVDTGVEQRLWGKVGVGAGVGVAAIGGILWSLAASDFARVQLDGERRLLQEDMVAAELAGRTKRTVGIAVVAGGAVLAGVGAAVWVLAPKAPVTIGAAPLQSGFALSVGGTLK
jgi:hypothetical protein